MDTAENLGSPEWHRRYAPNLPAYAWPSVDAMKKAYGDTREVEPVNLSAMICSDIAPEDSASSPERPSDGQSHPKRQKGRDPSSSNCSGTSSPPDDSGRHLLLEAIEQLIQTAKRICSSWEVNAQAARAATEAEERITANIQGTRAAIETLQNQTTIMEEDANLVKMAKDKASAAADTQAATVNALKEKIRTLAKSLSKEEEAKIDSALVKIRAVTSAKR